MQRQNNESRKNYTIGFIVLLSFIPIALFISNAEGNFRKAQVKQIASKRRDRLDREHGIDRKALQDDYQALDETYRLTEKDEIKKYMELGKTPKQYYEDRKAFGKDRDPSKSVVEAKPSMETLKETLMKKESNGMEVRYIQGDDFEQVKVNYNTGTVPDPRVGGSSITFDSRMSM
jgi:hypothetical protein